MPLHDKSGKPVAGLRCVINLDRLSAEFNETFVSGGGYFHIVDSKGKYIVKSNSAHSLADNNDFFTDIAKLTYADGFSVEQIMTAFTDKQAAMSFSCSSKTLSLSAPTTA